MRIISSSQPLVPSFDNELSLLDEFVCAYERRPVVKHEVMLAQAVVAIGILQGIAYNLVEAAFSGKRIELSNIVRVADDVRMLPGIV